MIGYKLSVADIILYYGLHRYLVRSSWARRTFSIISQVLVMHVLVYHRQEWHFSRKQVISTWAGGLIRFVTKLFVCVSTMSILQCGSGRTFEDLYLSVAGTTLSSSAAICTTTCGLSQESRHVDSLKSVIIIKFLLAILVRQQFFCTS